MLAEGPKAAACGEKGEFDDRGTTLGAPSEELVEAFCRHAEEQRGYDMLVDAEG